MHNSLKEQVLDSTDLVELVGERIALSKKGKEFVGLCPFHPDKDPSLNVNPAKQIFKCFACGAGGDAIKFVRLRDRVGFREAVETLAKRAGLSVSSSPADRERHALRDQLLRVLEWASSHFQRNLSASQGQRALEYARGRGLSDETIERFGLGFAADGWDDLWNAARRAGVEARLLKEAGLVTTNDSGRTYDRFRNRLIFPIVDGLGRTVAFGGRTLGDDPAKYLNSPETALFSKSRVLYGLNVARSAIDAKSQVIVVEGYTDAVLLHQHGIERVVATLGTALTDQHVKLLRPLADEAVLCFDGDLAGQRAADRGVETAVRANLAVRVAVLPGGQDPADYVGAEGAEGFEAALASAQDALQFKWQQMLTAVSQGEYRSRAAAIEAYVGFVAASRAAGGVSLIEHGLLVDRISRLVALPHEQVHELLERASRGLERSRALPLEDVGGEVEQGYAGLLAEVPPGLVAAVEDVFGLVLSDGQAVEWLDEVFAEAVGYCEAWQHLLETVQHVADVHGVVTREQVVAECDDEAALDVVRAAVQRVAAETDVAAAFKLAHGRLAAELELIKAGDLSERLRIAGESPAADQAFASLVQAAGRRSDGFLPPATRWRPRTN